MLESVGPLGYVIRKLNQVRQSGDTSQSRLEVIEIIEALDPRSGRRGHRMERISSSKVGWHARGKLRPSQSAPSYR